MSNFKSEIIKKRVLHVLLVIALQVRTSDEVIRSHEDRIQIKPPSRTGVKGWLYTTNPDYVRFLLFPNSENEDYFEELFLGNKNSVRRSQFDKTRPTIFLIHGLLGHAASLTDVQLIKNAYLSIHHNANIIMVDYFELGGVHFPLLLSWLNGPLSLPANLNVVIIGKRVAAFISFLKATSSISNFQDVHIVGFSMGCHVAGNAGSLITKTTGRKIGRISGLDCPFGQMFPILLEKSDASFVDMTHTSFGLGGSLGNVGHVDFYINGGGFSQPNCLNAVPITDPYCTHVSAVFYFSKSIRNKNMFGCKCKFCMVKPNKCNLPIRYGQFTNTNLTGKFFVSTLL